MLESNAEDELRKLVAAFAGPKPLPAGGAAAVTAIAMGVGLGVKVLRLSCPGLPLHDQTTCDLEGLLDRLVPEFTADCRAFSTLLAALRRARNETGREADVAEAWRNATEVPIAVAVMGREAEAFLSRCTSGVKPSIRADLEAALELVRAGRHIAERNARENAQHLGPQLASQLLAPLDGEYGRSPKES